MNDSDLRANVVEVKDFVLLYVDLMRRAEMKWRGRKEAFIHEGKQRHSDAFIGQVLCQRHAHACKAKQAKQVHPDQNR